MSLSGWIAIGCWGTIVAAILVAALVLGWRDWRKPTEPELLDFRDWLDDWDWDQPDADLKAVRRAYAEARGADS